MRDGRHFLLETAATAEGGRIIVITDVTALKEAERRSLEAVTDAIQALDEGLVLYDRDFNLVLANERFYEIFFAGAEPPRAGQHIKDVRAASYCLAAAAKRNMPTNWSRSPAGTPRRCGCRPAAAAQSTCLPTRRASAAT